MMRKPYFQQGSRALEPCRLMKKPFFWFEKSKCWGLIRHALGDVGGSFLNNLKGVSKDFDKKN